MKHSVNADEDDVYVFEIGERVQISQRGIDYFEDPEAMFYQDNPDWTKEKVMDLIIGENFTVIDRHLDPVEEMDGGHSSYLLDGLPEEIQSWCWWELEPAE